MSIHLSDQLLQLFTASTVVSDAETGPVSCRFDKFTTCLMTNETEKTDLTNKKLLPQRR